MTTVAQPNVLPAHAVRRLFSMPVVAIHALGPVQELGMHPDEAAHAASTIARRRQEFAAGRVCARRALAMLGIDDFPLIPGRDRFPIWPHNVVGSITHTRGYCTAAVSKRKHARGIGIDVELRGRIDQILEAEICDRRELAWLRSLPGHQREDMATVMFSAKEAFYKCQYCVTRKWVEFHDLHLTIGDGYFEVQPKNDVAATLRGPLKGRWRIMGEHVLTGVAIPAD